MDVDSTPFEELQVFHGLRSWKKEVIPERDITVGYNGPTNAM